MHQRQLSAGSAVELGRAFDSLLSAAPAKGRPANNTLCNALLAAEEKKRKKLYAYGVL